MTLKHSDGQIGLFPAETPYVPALQRSKTDFDPALAEKWKREKMAAAAASPAHQELLNLLRPALRAIALARSPDRCVTADDAQKWLVDRGYEAGALGNAAGSLFKGGEWKLIGYRMSDRVSRHRNRVGIWQLKSG
jgi:hypothetical protein